MKMKARRTAYYSYPVELVWKAIGFGSESREIDPLNEEEYEAKEPAPNTVFTRALEIRQNEMFAFQMKGRLFYSTMRIELEALRPCETRVRVREEIEPRGRRGVLFCLLAMNVRREVKTFCRDLGKKLDDQYSGKHSED